MSIKLEKYNQVIATGYYISPADVTDITRWLVKTLKDVGALKEDVRIVNVGRIDYDIGNSKGLCMEIEVTKHE